MIDHARNWADGFSACDAALELLLGAGCYRSCDNWLAASMGHYRSLWHSVQDRRDCKNIIKV